MLSRQRLGWVLPRQSDRRGDSGKVGQPYKVLRISSTKWRREVAHVDDWWLYASRATQRELMWRRVVAQVKYPSMRGAMNYRTGGDSFFALASRLWGVSMRTQTIEAKTVRSSSSCLATRHCGRSDVGSDVIRLYRR